jgi:diguanylate cyclase (GGDEF)-like protein
VGFSFCENGEDGVLKGYEKVHLKLGSHGLFLLKNEEDWLSTLQLLIKAGIQHEELCAVFSSISKINALSHSKSLLEKNEAKFFSSLERESINFFSNELYDSFKKLVLEAHEQNLQGVRVVLDLCEYADEVPASERLNFERQMDELLASREFPLTLICVYDLRKIKGDFTIELLDLHPHVIFRNVEEEPPFFVRIATRLFKDPLTKLYNVRYLHERLEEEIDRAKRYGGTFSILISDFDGFQAVNEKFGYIRGDKVLVETAKILTAAVRKVDLVCRYGDDSFILLLPETSQKGAQVISGRLRQAMKKIKLKNMELSFLIGTATFPEDGKTKEALFQKALKSLKSAKQQGEVLGLS